jgi:putative transposase
LASTKPHQCNDPAEIGWLSDNGSCYAAAETRSFDRSLGLKPVTTPVSSPQSSGMAESFVKIIKRDYVSLAKRPNARAAMQQLGSWFEHYDKNTRTAHWNTCRLGCSGNDRP